MEPDTDITADKDRTGAIRDHTEGGIIVKHTMKRTLALLIAILLALPLQSFALSEEAFDVVIDPAAIDDLAIDDMLDIETIDPLVEEIDDLFLDLSLDDLDLQPVESNGPAPASLVPFELSAVVDGVTFTVAAATGAFPAESVLQVSGVKDKETAETVKQVAKAVVGENITHRLYSIEVLDAAGNLCMPDSNVGLPEVHVSGLDSSGDLHVIMYDQSIDGYSEIKVEKDAPGFSFFFVGSAIYDIAEKTGAAHDTGSSDGQAQPEQSADDLQPVDDQQHEEQAADEQQPAEEGQPEQQSADEQQPAEEGQPEQQPVDEQQGADEQQSEQQPAEEQQPDHQPVEEQQPADEEQPAEEQQPVDEQQPADEEQPVDEQHPADEEQIGDEGQPEQPEEQPVYEQQPSDEEQPGDEEQPEEKPADEDQPAGEEQRADEQQPEQEPVDQPQPTDGEQSADEEQPAEEHQPSDENQPADEEQQPVDAEQVGDEEQPEQQPVEEQQPVDEQQPVEEQQPADEQLPVEEQQPVDEQQPADEQQQGHDQRPADEEQLESQPADEGQSAEEERLTDEQQPADEQPADEQPADEQPADEQPVEEVQPVSVFFDAIPDTAVVTVYPAATEEVPAPEAIPAEEDDSFLLLPGEYTYSAEAEGYVSTENVPFTVADESLTITVVLEADEPEPESAVPFNQSKTVSGVVVTVRAEAGVFPDGAVLSVKRVPVYKQRQADAAIDEVRDEDQNVAVSYTFDIKVMDAEGNELQPADGYTVEVSFALEEAADENLEANVYHITGDAGSMTAAALDTSTEGETVTATTDGFSLYTVEFTYNTLEYVLQGGGRVALNEVLSTLGLTGAPEAVVVSDDALFDATREGGEWFVAAKRAFSSTEWMKVTINEQTYEITVTDDQQQSVAYVNANGSSAGSQTCTVLTDQTVWGATGETTWYAVTDDVQIDSRVTISGNVNLILCDGATLTAKEGITVSNGNSLTVYGQSSGTGTLYAGTSNGTKATDYYYAAGIGGDSVVGNAGAITIAGGEIDVFGGYGGAGIGTGYGGSGGSVRILRGTVNAYGGENGAAIGAGISSSLDSITISGQATVVHAGPQKSLFGGAKGQYAAGIGGGVAGSVNTITISGGTVEAAGSKGGPGIGAGGDQFTGGTVNRIEITGGNILSSSTSVASGGEAGPGIGSGFKGSVGEVVIGGSATVTATAGYSGYLEDGSLIPAIGPGVRGSFGTLTLYDTARVWAGVDEAGKAAVLAWPDGRADACMGNVYAEIRPCLHPEADSLWITETTHNFTCRYCQAKQNETQHDFQGTDALKVCDACGAVQVAYVNADGTEASDSPKVCLQATEAMSDDNPLGGWYAVAKDTTLDTRVEITGDVNLILCDSCTLTASKGITVAEGNSLTIWAQSAGNSRGSLFAGTTDGTTVTCTDHDAAIGGANMASSGNITVNGGAVTASSKQGAGIGGGQNGACGEITINGGAVTAYAYSGACIGGGENANGGKIKITGGEVEASGYYGAGIGGGFRVTNGGDFKSISITGGKVTATNDGGGAGIGGGRVNKSDQNPYTPTGTITLDWSNATRAGMSVTASSYTGTVKLANDFCVKKDDGSFGAVFASTGDEAIADALRSAMGEKTLVPCDAHDITIAVTPTGTDNAVTASVDSIPVTKALEGTSVALAIAADEANNYSLSDVMARDADGGAVALTGTGDARTFTMPAKVVTVTATFKRPIAPEVSISGWTYGKTPSKPAIVEGGNPGNGKVTYAYYTDAACQSKTTAVDGAASAGGRPANAGDYWLKATVEETDGYYGGETAAVKFTVSPAAVTLTAGSGQYNYDGEEKTVTGFTCSVDGLTFDGVSASGKGTNAGEYPVTFTGVTVNTTKDTTGNYVVTKTVNGKLTIKPQGVTLTANSGEATYNGTEQNLTGYKCNVNGLIFADTVNASGKGTNAGDYDVVFSGISLNTTRDSTGNYVVTKTVNGKLTIQPKAVTITAKNASKAYDGKALAEADFTASALESGDTHTFTVAMTDASTITNAGDVPNVIATVDGTAVTTGVEKRIGNYLVTPRDGVLTINPKAVTITAKDASKTYDGTALSEAGFTASALEAGDTHTFTVAMTDASTITNAGDVPNVIATVDGTAVTTGVEKRIGNYLVTTKDGTLTVNPANATVTITGATGTAAYDGKEHKVSGYTAKADNGLYDITKDFTFSGKAEANRTDAGKTQMGLKAAQFVNTNKNFKTVIFDIVDGWQEINPINATVTIIGNTNTATYDGKAHTIKGYTATASTALYDVTKDFSVTGTASATQTSAGTASMGLAASQFVNTSPNFATVTFNVTDGYQTVMPAAITITADDKGSQYGKPLQTLTYVVGGAYVSGDDLGITLTTKATSSSDVGAYPITVTWNKNPNYTGTLTAGTYTITKGDLTVTASGHSGVYDGKAHSITVTAEGTGAAVYYSTQKLTAANYTTAGSTTPPTRTDAGTTTVYYYVVGSNYEAVSGSKDISIAQKTVIVVADDKSKTYGDADPELTYKVTGLIGSDKLTGSLTRKKGEKVGTYPIRQGTLKASDNYTLSFTGATFTIKERPVKPDITQQMVMTPVGDNALRLVWTKVNGAQGYDVFFKICDGKGNYPLVKTTKKLNCTIKKLKKGQPYKAYVKAWKKENGQKVYIGKATPTVHCIAGGYNKKRCNAKKVTVKEKKLTLAKGKSKRIVATVAGVKKGREVLHHAKLLRYFSSDRNVATVDRNGKVKAVGKGTCTITVMANNGVSATVKVTVK